MKIPEESTDWSKYVLTFTCQYWMVILVTLVVFILILTLYIDGSPMVRLEMGSAPVLASILALSVNLRAQTRWSIRIIFMTICLFGMLQWNIYTARITSLLTVQKHDWPVKSLEDVLPNRYQILIFKGTIYEDILKKSPVLRPIYEKTVKDNPKAFMQSYSEAIRRILSEDRVIYFGGKPSMMKKIYEQKLHCKIGIPPDMLKTKMSLALGFKKDSQYLPVFNHYLIKMSEAGVLEKMWKEAFVDTRDDTFDCESQQLVPISFEDIGAPFVLLVSLVGLALLFLCSELIVGKK